MKKSVLLIGGTGVLSSAVTTELLHQGFAVTMINRGSRSVSESVTLIKSNCNNYPSIKENLESKWFDAVIDFLCYTPKQLADSFTFYSKYTNQYFFISSCAVYNTELGGIFEEDSPKVLNQWQYSIDKWECEQTLTKLRKKSSCDYTIVRPCITYGDTRIPYGISPQYGCHWTLISRILANKPIITWNDGNNRANMLRVEDFAVGVVGLIGNSKAINEAFNICADDAPSYKEVLDVISEYLGQEVKTIDVSPNFYAEYYPSKKGEILAGRAIDTLNSNKKIKYVVPAFKQTISIKEGIIKTLKAYEGHNYLRGIDWQFDACTDRIIKKWCEKNHLETKSYNLRFVDYLGNATKIDRLTYWIEYHSDNVFIFIYMSIKKILGKIRRNCIQTVNNIGH